MPAHYCPISQEEMHEFLTGLGFKQVPPEKLPGTYEIVYGKRVDQDNVQMTLRINTSIVPSGEARDCGDDAIRVILFMRTDEGKVVKLSGSKRVNRIASSASNPEGWRGNLRERIESWTELLPEHSCPKCGMPMVPRKGKNGSFLGCTGYPACKHSQDIPKPKAK